MKRALLTIAGAALIGVGLLAQGQPARPGPELPMAACAGGTSALKATVSRRSPACRAIRSSTTPAARRAASVKTTDGGVHWQHDLRRRRPCSRSASLAVAPSDPNIVWAGTGEAWIRSHISVGEGIYKSTDAGKTWTRMGLEKTGPHRARRHRSRRTRTSSSRARSATRTARSRSAASFARPTAARTGRGRCSWTRTPAARSWRWIRATRASVRRHVAARDPHVGARQRRSGQRAVHIARRRRDVDEADRPRPADQARSAR